MQNQKAKWHYLYSEILKQQIAFDETSRWLFCKDGTKYSPREMAILTNGWQGKHECPLAVHIVKKTFSGEVVSYTEKND